MQENTFTQGNIVRGMLRFSVPYLITCFLQTFYGMADLFIVGQFNGAASITAVSVGSQLMHMLTVVIAGFAMGSTVLIARSVGAGDRREIAGAVSSTFAVFGVLAVGLTVLLLACTLPVVHLLKVPAEAVPEAVCQLFGARDAHQISETSEALRIVVLMFLPFGLIVMLCHFFQLLGKLVLPPVIMSLLPVALFAGGGESGDFGPAWTDRAQKVSHRCFPQVCAS